MSLRSLRNALRFDRRRRAHAAGAALTALAAAGIVTVLVRPRASSTPPVTTVDRPAPIASAAAEAAEKIGAVRSERPAQTAPPQSTTARPLRSENLEFDGMRAHIFAGDPALARFKALTEKVLRTSEEEEELGNLLADKAALGREREILHGSNERTRTEEGELHRIYAVDFLAKSLVWSRNPSRDDALTAVQAVLRDDNIPKSSPDDLRRSLSADKTELYQVLRDNYPAEAEALRRELKGTRLGFLFDRADARAEALARRQAEEPSPAP